MKTAGIIAEYNPFHNGHLYHIEKTKKETGADRIIVAMSGNFVQRGAPAILDKYARTKSALMSGADLVLQISPMYSIASAEFFAMGAVSLLSNTGIVDYLSFGSEAGELDGLKKIAEVLSSEPPKFKKALQKNLKNGNPFPVARSKAIIECCPELTNTTELLNSPNNILAIEYLKCLNRTASSIEPVTVKRKGAGYNDPYDPGSSGISSKAIREAVFYGGKNSSLASYMPEESHLQLKVSMDKKMTVDENDFSEMLIYKLLSERDKGYAGYLDVSGDMSDRILNNLDKFTNITSFCNLLKTKDKTYTRVSRALFHILLNIRNIEAESNEYTGVCPYIRVLGFRKSSEDLLSEIKARASVPIITGYNDAVKNLYSEPMELLKKESRIEDLYFAVQAMKSGLPCKPDMSRPVIVI